MIAASAAKAAPAITPPLVTLAALGVDGSFLIKIVAVIFGVGLGAMWRAGMLRQEGKDWETIKTDLFVSVLIGGANSVLSLGCAELFGAGALISCMIGVIIGATGLRALPQIRNLFIEFARSKIAATVAPPPVTQLPPFPADSAEAQQGEDPPQ